MANIKVSIDYPISDGTKLKFRTPCESTEVDGLIVKSPMKDGIGSCLKTFLFVDAHGTELSGVGNVFTSDVMIEVLLDVTKGRAYIKNADTNSYIESIKETLARMDEERKAIYAEAGKSIKECNDATKNASEAANTLNLSAKEIRSSGFVEALKELNNGRRFNFWVGTEEEYEEDKNTLPANTFCIITDDTSYEEIEKDIEQNSEEIKQVEEDITQKEKDIAYNKEAIEEMHATYFDKEAGTLLDTVSGNYDPSKYDTFVGILPHGTPIVFEDITYDEETAEVTAISVVGMKEHRLTFYWRSDGYDYVYDGGCFTRFVAIYGFGGGEAVG